MTPEVGLVIRHIYLWRDEHLRGHLDGQKARPCVIIHTRLNEHSEREVYICPITHTQPENSGQSIEIPLATKQRLKLDNQPSWIITTEVNLFKWKGPDVKRRGNRASGYVGSAFPDKRPAIHHQGTGKPSAGIVIPRHRVRT